MIFMHLCVCVCVCVRGRGCVQPHVRASAHTNPIFHLVNTSIYCNYPLVLRVICYSHIIQLGILRI